MYNDDQKIKAVQMYFRLKNYPATREIMGYPDSLNTLRMWVKEYRKTGTVKSVLPSYSEEEIDFACEYFKECGSIPQTVKDLGYPDSRMTLWRWLRRRNIKLRSDYAKTKEYNHKARMNIIIGYFKSGTTLNKYANNIGVSYATIKRWINDYEMLKVGDDYMAAMKENPPIIDIEKEELTDQEELDALKKELKSLKEENKKTKKKLKEANEKLDEINKKVADARLEYEVLEKAAKIIKKDEGIDVNLLTNREKAIVINALRKRYSLYKLLKTLKMAKSSYMYQNKAMSLDKYASLRIDICDIFLESYEAFGYRRIHAELRNRNIRVSEKVVRRIMKEDNIHPFVPKMKKYSSYQGEISPAVPDLYKHNFKADRPFEKFVTDITEFHINAGKIYLSPMIDLFDGCPITWKIGISPSDEFTSSMLKETHELIPGDTHPIIHSDRGMHYRTDNWIRLMEEYGYTRSMSRKGCSPDNAACEGYFGILKREFFHNHDWSKATIEEFIKALDDYLKWFKIKRIKERLGYLSPMDYRASLGY